MGMYLRFAAVEVVPKEFSSRAVTWVLCGGCLAAFAGPEAAQATIGMFGEEEHLTYLGVFVVAGCFYVAQAIFVGLASFHVPPTAAVVKAKKAESLVSNKESDTAELELSKIEQGQADMDPPTESTSKQSMMLGNNDSNAPKKESPIKTDNSNTKLLVLLKGSNFLLPLMFATLTWAIMAMPMGIFRVVMKELGYTSRQSLTVIELHFLGMYAPGFWSGTFIKTYGPIQACKVAIGFFLVATAINLASQDNNDSIATWYLGLIFLGCGWNLGFSSTTVWVTQVYSGAPHLKGKVQAANEAGMFLFSGAAIFCTGYLYESAGGGGLQGWRVLNYTLLGLICLLIAVILVALRLRAKKESSDKQIPTARKAIPPEETSLPKNMGRTSHSTESTQLLTR
jgi:MFS family permease